MFSAIIGLDVIWVVSEMSDILIVDDFLGQSDLENIQNNLSDEMFPWNYVGNVSGIKTITDVPSDLNISPEIFYFINDVYIFSHGQIKHFHKPLMELLDCILIKLYIRALIRIKINMYTKTEVPYFHGYHCDANGPNSKVVYLTSQVDHNYNDDNDEPYTDSKTAIFYVDTNNGQTDIDGERVDSVENRIIIFPNNIRHSSITQTDTNRRIVINFNYF